MLLTLLMVAVFGLIDGSVRLWRKSETRRNLTEQATGVMELLSHDFRSLQGGERGDLLVEYTAFDTDGDGLRETVWPRIRLVRQAQGSTRPWSSLPKGRRRRLPRAAPSTPTTRRARR